MTFVYPALLFALLLGALPIIIYYLMRFRSLRVSWGADYILERALARRRKRLYLDQIILLALRALVVMALVTAFARPQSRRVQTLATDGEVLRILVVDGSYSLLAREGQHSRREVAMTALRQLVGQWNRGEQWSLFALDDNPRWIVEHAAVISPEHTLRIIDQLQVSETAVSLAAALETVFEHERGRAREIYLVTDDLARTWDGVEQIRPPEDENTRIFWIHPPLADRRNLAVTSLVPAHERVLQGFLFPVYAQIRNFSDERIRDTEVAFLVNGVLTASERISLPPGQTLLVRTELRLDEPGSHLISARLSDDVLAYDNAMDVGIEVIDSLDVRVLRDLQQTGKFHSAAGFLSLAARILAGGTARPGDGPMRITEITEPDIDTLDLARADAIVLDGGRTLTNELAQQLRQAVASGASLVLACDDTVDLDAWRRHLGPLGLLPANPLRVRNEPIGGSRYQRLSRSGFDSPALRTFEADRDGDLTQIHFYTWMEFDAPQPDAEILARFADGTPFAWHHRFERGSVILLAAGLNARNNNLLVRETVYPLLLHLFSEAASARIYPRRLVPRLPVRYLATGAPDPIASQFSAGDDPPVIASLSAQPGGMLVEHAEGADRTGPASLLVLREDRQERIWFGIQGERMDSDLTPLDPEMHKRLAEEFSWTEVSSGDALLEALAEDGRGQERYGWVLMAVLAFGIAELLMGLRFI